MVVRSNQKGFSLIEVALILLIMGIIGVAAVPSIVQAKRQEVSEFAKELCLDLVNQKMNDRVCTNIYLGKESTSMGISTISYTGVEPAKAGVSSRSSTKSRDIQKVNTATYNGIKLQVNATGNGYNIIDDAGKILVSRTGAAHLKITICQNDGTPDSTIKELNYVKGVLKANIGGTEVPYTDKVEIIVENNQAECRLIYYPTTGYYTIS